MVFRTFLAGTLSVMALVAALRGAESGESVVLIYNTRLPNSKDVADHYAARRSVPAGQIIGLALRANVQKGKIDDAKKLMKLLENLKAVRLSPSDGWRRRKGREANRG